MRVRERSSSLPVLSIAPLVDVVFLLVIFFMAATTWVEPEQRLELELPTAESGSAAEARDELVIAVLPDGSLVLDGRTVAESELRAALQAAARRSSGTPVTVRGDRRVPHGAIVAVLDACGSAGLANLSVGTLER